MRQNAARRRRPLDQARRSGAWRAKTTCAEERLQIVLRKGETPHETKELQKPANNQRSPRTREARWKEKNWRAVAQPPCRAAAAAGPEGVLFSIQKLTPSIGVLCLHSKTRLEGFRVFQWRGPLHLRLQNSARLPLCHGCCCLPSVFRGLAVLFSEEVFF